MRSIVVSFVVLLSIARSTSADELREWIHQKIELDSKNLTKSLQKLDGYDIDLLAAAKSYVPFFLELPSDVPKDVAIPAAFAGFVNRFQKSFVPGGYLFRMSFSNGYVLYALSAGDWSGLWFDPKLRREFLIEPSTVRTALNVPKERYVTVLAGAPTQLIVYDDLGTVVTTHEFDLRSATIEDDITQVLRSHAALDSPSLQMVLLGEYIEGSDLPWRQLSSNPNINFRNQQEDPGENTRIARFGGLKREQVQNRLQLPLRPTPTSQPTPNKAQQDRPLNAASVR